jgi:hypothetical protein
MAGWSFVQHEPQAHESDAMGLQGSDALRPWLSGDPGLPGLSKHERDVGPVDVGIKESDPLSVLGQCHGEVAGHHGLPYPSLAGADGDDGADTGEEARLGRGGRHRSRLKLPSSRRSMSRGSGLGKLDVYPHRRHSLH